MSNSSTFGLSDTPRVRNMESARGNKVANQFVISTEEFEVFQSYSTVIAKRRWGATRGERGWLALDEEKWDFSRTTIRYRNEFTGLSTRETESGIKDGTIALVDLN